MRSAMLCLLFLVQSVLALPIEEFEVPRVTPQHLDSLLASKQYDEFSRLMRIKNVNLVRPSETPSENPMFNEGLEHGDILDPPDIMEEGRQGLRFDRVPERKWPNGVVPYAISEEYGSEDVARIEDAIKTWNAEINCIKYKPLSSFQPQPNDYVMYFPGDGCFSNLGRAGDQQPISLQVGGCFRKGTILHEMNHAIGFTHEQNRYDRDNYIEMLWSNIPPNWQPQYKKTTSSVFGLQGAYDYYSVMHYPMQAPETGGDAFRVRKSGINKNRIGQRVGFTDIDKQKIHKLYC